MQSLFHLAIHVTDLDETRAFYGDVLGCTEGRSTDTWVDFNFFGHQLSFHLGTPFTTTRTGKVGDHMVMMPHMGVVLRLDDWLALSERLAQKGITFDIPPVIRFEGEPGEQRTMFFFDPSGNPIEVKGFADFDGLFAR
ncbi:VOC family protein [Falsirhodobacter sp. 20TX0035]|uniref:VOC family protein n=1 Tax=Falsirhodobacter sp. 20TX0035 TaxID=3022019 RepID=UPI00232E19EB|nr:VOC family protein [Falsirhodobacter sp. 20TX0035]MDB6454197.1 VOC family protein [Falsirhodobacter sp. 20TX0035]